MQSHNSYQLRSPDITLWVNNGDLCCNGPQGALKEELRAALGGKRVGIRENCFDLGGRSLSVVRIVSRLSQSLHADIPLRLLFEYPTVASLAAKIENRADDDIKRKKMHQSLDDLEALPST
jgi:hypothetical protein